MKYEPTKDEKEVFTYLDELQQSGKIDMYKAAYLIVDRFAIHKLEANRILTLWMSKVKDESRKRNGE